MGKERGLRGSGRLGSGLSFYRKKTRRSGARVERKGQVFAVTQKKVEAIQLRPFFMPRKRPLLCHNLVAVNLIALLYQHDDDAFGMFAQVKLLEVIAVERVEFFAEKLTTFCIVQ